MESAARHRGCSGVPDQRPALGRGGGGPGRWRHRRRRPCYCHVPGPDTGHPAATGRRPRASTWTPWSRRWPHRRIGGAEAVPALRQASQDRPGPRDSPGAPVGRWVPTPCGAPPREYLDQLTGLQSALSTALTFGEIGGNCWEIRPRSVTSWRSCPQRARGTGGFPATTAIITSQDGKVSIDTVGSKYRPAGPQTPARVAGPAVPRPLRRRTAAARHDEPVPRLPTPRSDLAEVVAAAHRPASGRGHSRRCDSAEPHGWRIRPGHPLPEGGSIGGADLARFAAQGIYEKFPRPTKTRSATLTRSPSHVSPRSIVRPPRPGHGEGHREALSDTAWWSGPTTDVGSGCWPLRWGSLRVPDGHQVEWCAEHIQLQTRRVPRSLVDLTFGRCVDAGGQTAVHVTFTLENAIPFRFDPRVHGRHSANGSGLVRSIPAASDSSAQRFRSASEADVDGEPVDYTEFRQQGGPPSCSTWNCPARDEDRGCAFLRA